MNSDFQSSGVEILKADLAGRVHRRPEEIEAILDEFEKSSMSGAQFARHYGLKYATFASWRAKRRKNGRNNNEGKQNFSFLEVIADEEPADAVNIKIADSICIEVQNQNQAAIAAKLIKEILNPK